MTVQFDKDGFALTTGVVTVYVVDADGYYTQTTDEHVVEGTTLSAGSHLDAPPAIKDGYLIKRKKNGWEYQQDCRGTYYRTDTAEPVEITEIDADLQNLTPIKPLDLPCKWNGSQWVIDEDKQAEIKAQKRQQFITAIDDKAASIYSVWTRFEQEYTSRENAAKVFKNANYQGEVSRFIADFASKAGIDNKTACELILVQAEGLRKLLVELANQRMRKYELQKDGLTEDEMQAIYNDIIQQMEKLTEAYQNG